VAAEVVGDSFVVGGHGGVAFLPIHGADFTVLFEMLEGVDDAEAFLDGASEGHVVDDLVAHPALKVDKEETAVGDEFSFDEDIAFVVDYFLTCEDVVGFGDCFVNISDERIGDALNTAFVLGGVKPCPVREFGVRGAADDGNIAGFELGDLFLESVELGGTDEGKVLGVEEEDDVFLTDELIEREGLEDVFTLDGFRRKGGGFFSNQNRHDSRWDI